MKVLVLEENSRVSKIYEKIFRQKEIDAEFVSNNAEFLKRAKGNYDFFIFESPLTSMTFSEVESFELETNEKFLFLSSHMNKDEQIPQISKETRDIVEKPFAMISLLTKLEFDLNKKLVTI